MIKHIYVLLMICVSIYAENLDSLVEHSIEFAGQQLANSVVEVGDSTKFPKCTREDGSWKLEDSGHWTAGFFPGCLWYAYEATGNEDFRRWAARWTAGMEREKYHTRTHNVGFMMMNSFANGYRLTADSTYRDVILEGAKSMATRYNNTVGAIHARKWSGTSCLVVIDNMASLELLFWAALNGGGDKWYDMAVQHALTTIRDFVREDGSTFQQVDYNPNTGAVITKRHHQGYSVNTTWSRGQSWATYGFTKCYQYTGDLRFLDAARRTTDYFIDHLPADYVPYWDFEAPNIPDEEQDASAAAIALAGIFELSRLVPHPEDRERYWNAALNILASLTSQAYLAEYTNSHGILQHGVQNRNKNKDVDVSLIYADYYFLEALLKYRQSAEVSNLTEETRASLPSEMSLLTNYPNPFNSGTKICIQLLCPSYITLQVYDLLGNQLQSVDMGYKMRGRHSYIFNAKNLSSGAYIIVMNTDNEAVKKKIMLLR